MAFGTDSIPQYLWDMEEATLDQLVANWGLGPYPMAGGVCLYGRSGHTGFKYVDGVYTADNTLGTRPVTRTEQGFVVTNEDYSCTGYGSAWALWSMAKRHDHTTAKTKLVHWTKHWIDISRRMFSKHGIGPGENMIHEPYNPFSPYGRGDTDPWRHCEPFGHMQILIDADAQALSCWDTTAALSMADLYRDWVIQAAPSILNGKSVREYLRYGNRMSVLAGCYDVYSAYGSTTEADETLKLAAGLVSVIYPEEWRTVEPFCVAPGEDTATWCIWNYGALEPTLSTSLASTATERVFISEGGDTVTVTYDIHSLDPISYHWPFQYGWSEYTSQPWYDGHQVKGAYRLALRFASATLTGTYFTSGNELYNWAFQRLVQYVDDTTQWYCYGTRHLAPLGDMTAHGSADFTNCKLVGFKYGTATNQWIDSYADDGTLTIAAWDGLTETDTYYPFGIVYFHESDGKYFELLYTDTIGKLQQRYHKSTDVYTVAKGYGTNSAAFAPRLEVRGSSYGVPDMLWIRGQMFNDDDERNFARVCMFDYLAYANDDSNTTVRKEDRMNSAYGWSPLGGNGMSYARAWHWTVMCGELIRETDLAANPSA